MRPDRSFFEGVNSQLRELVSDARVQSPGVAELRGGGLEEVDVQVEGGGAVGGSGGRGRGVVNRGGEGLLSRGDLALWRGVSVNQVRFVAVSMRLWLWRLVSTSDSFGTIFFAVGFDRQRQGNNSLRKRLPVLEAREWPWIVIVQFKRRHRVE